MTWHNLLKSTPRLILFCLGATYNTLASPQNLAHWGFEDDIECALCRKEEASVAHILAGCQKALQSGIYTFCHNFVIALPRKYNKSGILQEAKDWVMEVDVDQQLRFPEAIFIHGM